MIDSLEVIVYTGLFIMPGWILNSALEKIMPSKEKTDSKSVLIYLFCSILNYTVWSWLYIWILKTQEDMFWYWPLLILISLLTPLISGVVIGLAKKNDWLGWLLWKIKISSKHPIPIAWDYKFSKQEEGCWVNVYLKNGDNIRGLFYTNSFASSEAEKRDIFIEEVWTLGEDDTWEIVPNTGGAWISSDEIMMIEFFNLSEDVEKEENQNG